MHTRDCPCARCEIAPPSSEARERAEREARGRLLIAQKEARDEPKRLVRETRLAAQRAQTDARLAEMARDAKPMTPEQIEDLKATRERTFGNNRR